MPLWLTANDDFAEAVKAHSNGNLEQALKAYERVESEGKISKELYANMGRIYYELNNIGHALLYYERALKYYGDDESIQAVIENLQGKMTISLSDIPDFILVRAFRYIALSVGQYGWIFIQLLGFVVLISLIYRRWFTAFDARRKLWPIALASLFILFCIAMGRVHHSAQFEQRYGIIIEDNVELMQAADERSPVVAPLAAGMKALILDELTDWYKIRLTDRDEGWVKKEKAKII